MSTGSTPLPADLSSLSLESPTVDHNVAVLILDRSKPLIVKLIERLQQRTLFHNMHWLVIGLLLAVAIYVPALPWLMIGVSSGPNNPLVYLAGSLLVIFCSLVCVIGAEVCYRRATHRLPQVITTLRVPAETVRKLPRWADRFRPVYRLRFIGLFGIIWAFLGFLMFTAFHITDPVSLLSGILAIMLTGMLSGDFVYFFFNLLSVTPVLLDGQLNLYALNPSESIGLQTLVNFSVQFVGLAATIGTLFLSGITLFLVAFTESHVDLSYVAIAAGAVMVWISLVIPLRQVIIASVSVIRNEKERTLDQLQTLIAQKYTAMDSSDVRTTLDDMEKLMTLYNGVRNSPNFPIELLSVGRLALGFALPALPSIIQRLVH
jgi:hypothetical protein